ncbi:ceramide kinase-like isoform X1 [Salvia splendens]|uniref:ceramide kinase-like isoform X1 n=2 Tax=Salvia splendens TaxID=180675 RepID=UPI001C26EFBB|nr:ceramide kinase-like isoform X1 [Salvia splendens]
METNQDGFNSPPNPDFANADQPSVSCCNFLLDRTGEVVITHTSDGLSWRLVDSLNDEGDNFSCLGFKLVSNTEMEVNIADVFAVNFIGWGLVHESALASLEVSLSDHSSEMYRFTIYVVHKSKTQSSVWTPLVYTFGHKDLEICMSWVNQINSHLNMEVKRPKNLLVLVHPRSGKGHGCKIWETVAPLFSQAKVKTKVIVTERAGHARDMLSSITNRELNLYDGVVAVGGDGFFNEILNGVLLSRHKAPYPPTPSDITPPAASECNVSNHNVNRTLSEHCDHNEDGSPLLRGSENIGLESSNFGKDSESPFPNEMFRFGLIPAGSTDAIVICTTGARDAVTSALHIILGKKVHLDIAQVVRWKETNSANEEPCVRYAASFAGYGFYGDVITESEKYRWMGPKRYDYAGTKVFLQHKSYEAEVSYLEVEAEETSSSPEADPEVHSRRFWCLPKKPDRMTCHVNCAICNSKSNHTNTGSLSLAQDFKGMKWSSSKGRYLSVGAAVISCRNEKAPDGLVADAHLSDGFLHLILIKECPHPYYLWHLIQLARKGGEPLGYKFVEHHKTPAFTFKSLGKEGVWNVDGEPFLAQQLSVQVFRGLVSLFATGPQE